MLYIILPYKPPVFAACHPAPHDIHRTHPEHVPASFAASMRLAVAKAPPPPPWRRNPGDFAILPWAFAMEKWAVGQSEMVVLAWF